MTRLHKAALILKYLGPGWAAYRAKYALELRLGLVARRSPCCAWADIPADAKLPDWLLTAIWPQSGRGWGDQCITQADGLSLGQFELFFHLEKHLGCPPNWHRNSLTGQTAPRGLHWSRLGDFDFGDIKGIWEPSRFAWAFTLARAHARTGEARVAELFWKLFGDWCAQNPPNEGVNWKCGQESTFRLIAVTFAVAQFGRLPSATPERLELWSRFVTATGRRIAANIDYALSQSNNHGVSECVGLITAGLLTSDSDGWVERGLTSLRQQLDELVYADGGFSQHSLIYHRVLLHDLLWLIQLLRLAGKNVPDWLENKTRLSWSFLGMLIDPATGQAPVFGANDSSNILPLDECAAFDLRGVIQAGSALLDGTRVYPPGPWDEALFWLTGLEPATLPVSAQGSPVRWHAPQSGCFRWRSGVAQIFLHCPTHFRHRPSQADMLHIDVRWHGRPITHDAGTYSYNTSGLFDGAFSKAVAHSVPMLVGREPLRKASRFLYLPWPSGMAEWLEPEQRFPATHDGYGRDAQIERSITSPSTGVFDVTDKLVLHKSGRVRLHWLLADADWQLDQAARTVSAKLPEGVFTLTWQGNQEASAASLVRADLASPRGWWSPFYGTKAAAVSFELLFNVSNHLEIITRFSPGA